VKELRKMLGNDITLCIAGNKVDLEKERHVTVDEAETYVLKVTRSSAIAVQGDHLSGKPGNVGEFDSCQGNVRDFTKNQGNVRENILSVKSCLKLFIVSCIFASIQVFSGSLFYVKY